MTSPHLGGLLAVPRPCLGSGEQMGKGAFGSLWLQGFLDDIDLPKVSHRPARPPKGRSDPGPLPDRVVSLTMSRSRGF